MTTRATRLPNNLGQFFISKHIDRALADKSKKDTISYRLANLSKTYGVPTTQVCRLAKISYKEASYLVNGAYDNATDSVMVRRLNDVIDRLEKVLPLLDEKHYRPRTWPEALNLCLSHAE